MSSSAAVDEASRDGEDPALQGAGGGLLQVWAGQATDGACEVVGHHAQGEPGGVGHELSRGQVRQTGALELGDPRGLEGRATVLAKPPRYGGQGEAQQWRDVPDSVTSTGATARDARRLRFLHNWSPSPAEVRIPAAVADVLGKASFAPGYVVPLGPWDVRVLIETTLKRVSTTRDAAPGSASRTSTSRPHRYSVFSPGPWSVRDDPRIRPSASPSRRRRRAPCRSSRPTGGWRGRRSRGPPRRGRRAVPSAGGPRAAASAVGIVRRVEEPVDPRRVRRPRGHGVDPDAFADVVGRHRQRQRVDRALGGGVEDAVADADQRRPLKTRSRSMRRWSCAAAEVARGGDSGHRHDVDVEHVMPLVAVIGGDVARCADTGVVDSTSRRPKRGPDVVIARATVGVLSDVAQTCMRTVGDGSRAVKHDDGRSSLRQLSRYGCADAAGAAGHGCDQSCEVLHDDQPPSYACMRGSM